MRTSGVLLPIASLPSEYGIGCFSKEAYAFVDALKKGGQSCWQILPLGPTGYGDSPYQSFSTFAGNPYFIDPETLIAEGLLTREECDACDFGSDRRYIDYEKLYQNRFTLLKKAFARFVPDEAYGQFTEDHAFWLNDYALFMAIKDSQNGISWSEWEAPLKLREKETLKEKRAELEEEIRFICFLQYEFYRQWNKLKNYANSQGIQMIGDIPIYVAFDSADAWANPELFQFDEAMNPLAVAGCPPDAFSATGQLWGNPLYRWDYHEETGFAWWIARLRHCFQLYDVVRVDHFRGFDAYYAIPYGDATAEFGTWQEGPGIRLFDAAKKELGEMKIIAEDLGFLTDSVRKMVKDTGYPGMKVLQFAFDSRDESDYLPHNYEKNCVVYTGTHDNNTILGWLDEMSKEDRRFAARYMDNTDTPKKKKPWDFIRLAMASVADLAVIPLQDYLCLGSEARINTPSTLGGNWKWRLLPGQLSEKVLRKMRKMTKLYGRQKGQKENIRIYMEQEKKRRQNNMEMRLEELLSELFRKSLDTCGENELYTALLRYTREACENLPRNHGEKKLYYISAEFLVGKLLSNNLINLGLYERADEILRAHGFSLSRMEELEPEPSLGNGGLGRLAACFLDSIATLGLPGDGIGLNYHFGLFRQLFEENKQKEVKNPWIQAESWLTRQPEQFIVPFDGFSLKSVLYDIDVPGYESGCNRLHLFDVDSVDEAIVEADSIDFDKTAVKKNLTLFLYPDDSDDDGRKLRIYQQYFMVSCGAQYILNECERNGYDLHRLHEHVVIQINDTHPSLVIPELIRLLLERDFSMSEAIRVVEKTCAYTNHTILAEALETWPMSYLKEVVPHLVPIIQELDHRIRKNCKDKTTYIIDKEKRVHMAHMDIHYGFSVNGVAALHTDILKHTELKNFYKIYPEKFNNKTNGITFRRWLLHCNHRLTDALCAWIGDGFKKDANELEKLLQFREDTEVLKCLEKIKQANKTEFANFLRETQETVINDHSIYDVQVKRLHEYKRQQMNALYAIYKYLEIKAGKKPSTPITMIFGAKAAPAYVIAKDIIHLILCLQELIENDPEVRPYFRVVMLENYNVSLAEKMIPAADISEQISLASKEASGTGNMKFMLNGALTLGTEDGANVEIRDLVGEENIYIFGKKPQDVIDLYESEGYCSRDIYEEDELIHTLVDFIIGKEMLALGDEVSLKRLHQELVGKDWFMTLLDTKEYIATKEKMYADYEDHTAWNKKALINIAKAGFFSSDRTIAQYNEDIWKLNAK